MGGVAIRPSASFRGRSGCLAPLPVCPTEAGGPSNPYRWIGPIPARRASEGFAVTELASAALWSSFHRVRWAPLPDWLQGSVAKVNKPGGSWLKQPKSLTSKRRSPARNCPDLWLNMSPNGDIFPLLPARNGNLWKPVPYPLFFPAGKNVQVSCVSREA
jgi:hypothetical protein